MDIQQIKLISQAEHNIDDRLIANPIENLSNDEYWIMVEKEYERLRTVYTNTELINKLLESGWKLDGLIVSKDKAELYVDDNKLYPAGLDVAENPMNYEIISTESAEEYGVLVNKYETHKSAMYKASAELENFLDRVYNPVSSVKNYFKEREDE